MAKKSRSKTHRQKHSKPCCKLNLIGALAVIVIVGLIVLAYLSATDVITGLTVAKP
jgi:hypothetical protein